MREKISLLRQWLIEDNRIVVFTGAGVSTASGIPDFRGKNGLYKKKQDVSVEKMLSHSYFVAHPESFYQFMRKSLIFPHSKPNSIHEWVASLQEDHELTVITQNIDALHQQAGTKRVLELHGNVGEFTCMQCGKTYDVSCLKQTIPQCTCKGMIRPNIVLYEEMLDDEVLSKSIMAMMKADMVIVMGSSLVVQPAASLLRYYSKDHLVILNREDTPYDKIANLVIHEEISKIIQEI